MKSIAVVCTDRGQHPEARVATLLQLYSDNRGPQRSDHVDVEWSRTAREGGGLLHNKMPGDQWTGADGTPTFRLACQRCRRNHEIKQPRLDDLFKKLDAAGVSLVDLSWFPC